MLSDPGNRSESSGMSLAPDEIVRRGQDAYERTIRDQVEPLHSGKFLVINVLTGEYELDVDDAQASRRARERFNGAPMFTMRIGHSAAYRLGGRFGLSIFVRAGDPTE